MPVEWYGNISMRMELYGCPGNAFIKLVWSYEGPKELALSPQPNQKQSQTKLRLSLAYLLTIAAIYTYFILLRVQTLER